METQTEAYATWDSACNISHFHYLRNIISLALTLVSSYHDDAGSKQKQYDSKGLVSKS